MKQIVLIHGGESYSSYNAYLQHLKFVEIDYERLKPQQKWKTWIAEQLPDVDVLLPTFPNSSNAVYDEWRIYFEKLVPFLGDDVQLVGHSLGAMFLAKYLHNHTLPKKARRLILIAGVYDDDFTGDNGSFMPQSATGLEKSADELHLFHSKDDPVAPYAELVKFQRDLPTAMTHSFETRGHFLEPTFPELLEVLQNG